MNSSKMFSASLMIGLLCTAAVSSLAATRAGEIDLSRAVVIVPDGLGTAESKAVQLLVDEVRRRSNIGWDVMLRWPADDKVPVIAVGPARLIDSFPDQYQQLVPLQPASKEKEGFRIQTVGGDGGGSQVVSLIGNDARGVLFGVGRLLRSLRMSPGHVTLAASLNLSSAPRYPLRGHQLGYGHKTNSYDATYRLSVVYTGDMFQVKIALEANESIEVHHPLLKPRDLKPLECDLPIAATRNGTLTLSWTAEPNQRRQRPRLPGGRGLVDQEVGHST
jgi:hypothetical protein